MTPDEFRSAGHRLIDTLADFIASLPKRPVTRALSGERARLLVQAGRDLPAAGTDPDSLLQRTAGLLIENSLFNAHPRFWGYITSSPAPIGILGDLLASAMNPNLGSWKLSPVASEIEAQSVRWIASMLGYPTSCGGLFVSGGNMANITCLVAARHAQADWDIRKEGIAGGAGRLRLYVSAETHTWVQKATDMCGLGTDAIRWVEADSDQRIRIDSLRAAIRKDREAGHIPFMVVGNAGTVSTGAVDPLDEIADICREYGLWFHVDGAYGGFAAVVPEETARFRAVSTADSVAVDPHKWLYAPLEAGCALVRDLQHLKNAFSYHPAYYHFGDESLNYVDVGPQNSRGFRALKVWLGLQHVGREGYARMIADDIALARALAELIQHRDDMQFFTHNLSITTFRYVPPELSARKEEADAAAYLDQLNREILVGLERGGEAFVSNAVIGRAFALRLCVVNFHTSLEDIEALPEIVARVGQAVDARLRPTDLRAPA